MGRLNKRHEELMDKIFRMGYALHEEGQDKDDYRITAIGDFMILISGLIHDEDDISLFGELCSMFSAKKILESQMETGDMPLKSEDDLEEMLNMMKQHLDNIEDDENNDEPLDTDLDEELE